MCSQQKTNVLKKKILHNLPSYFIVSKSFILFFIISNTPEKKARPCSKLKKKKPIPAVTHMNCLQQTPTKMYCAHIVGCRLELLFLFALLLMSCCRSNFLFLLEKLN